MERAAPLTGRRARAKVEAIRFGRTGRLEQGCLGREGNRNYSACKSAVERNRGRPLYKNDCGNPTALF